ncbi:hypothetical protein O3P69_014715 [Scylla paramamosain]|uniref:Pacifastin domain-containing protein n=1 Tax=Scylla paramamosain TaxID=85552 RepID=A0AAW0U0U2_SCYPA
MKAQVVMVALVVVLAVFTQVEACVPGTSWFDGCNRCICINRQPACTKKACKGYRGRRAAPHIPHLE